MSEDIFTGAINDLMKLLSEGKWLEFIAELVKLLGVGALLVIGWNERIESAKSILKNKESKNIEKLRQLAIQLI